MDDETYAGYDSDYDTGYDSGLDSGYDSGLDSGEDGLDDGLDDQFNDRFADQVGFATPQEALFNDVDDLLASPARYSVHISVGDGVELPERTYADLERLAYWALEYQKVAEPAELSLVVVSSAEMRGLNNDYRGVDKATDVLSFPSGWDEGEIPEPGQPLVLGDIVICPEVADRIDYGQDFELERKLEILLIHGVLHLLGYDHEQDDEAGQMENEEDSLLAAWIRLESGRQSGTQPPGGRQARHSAALPVVDALPDIAPGQPVVPGPPPERVGAAQLTAGSSIPAATSAELAGRPKHSLVQAFVWAASGFGAAIRRERNLQIHLVVAVLALVASAFLSLVASEWAAIIICIGAVLSAELLNTAIELVIDQISTEWSAGAKLAKDVSAAMVLVTAICAVAVGLLVFINAVLRLLG